VLSSRRAHLDDPLRSERSCVLGRGGMVATSVPAASEAGLQVLRDGGNAMDAAIAAAAVLCVVEPMMTGIGGDAFVLLWSQQEGRLLGLNGSGRAPSGHHLEHFRELGIEQIAPAGILSATVPGAVHAWETLHRRLGRLPFARLLEPAARLAEEGFPVSELVAHYWKLTVALGALRNEAARRSWTVDGAAPAAGTLFRAPGLARVLREIAQGGAQAFYEGRAAQAILRASREEGGGFTAADLAGHASTWVEPVTTTFRGTTVAELPPNGQGLTALLALNILECFDPADAPVGSALEWHRRIESIKLAFADRDAYIADPDHSAVPVEALLSKDYARKRASLVGDKALPLASPGLGGDTTYLCTADAEGNLVSFIQSLFTAFGSGVGCGDTDIVLQSRGAGFRMDPTHPNALAPGKRPLHTIIPGMLLEHDVAKVAFGLMGGDVQPQSHLNFVANVVDHGCNVQEALDRPRFRVDRGAQVRIEAPQALLPEGGHLGAALQLRGHEVVEPGAAMADRFGGGQAIALLANGVLAGGSDRRKDGCALPLTLPAPGRSRSRSKASR